MATKATAVAMAFGMLGCATAGLPHSEVQSSGGGLENEEVRKLAVYFSKMVDCRPGTKDRHAFLCPLAATRGEPFVLPEQPRPLLGVEIVLRRTGKWLDVVPELERPLVAYVGRGGVTSAFIIPSDGPQADWNASLSLALLKTAAGNDVPVVPPFWAEPLLQVHLPRDDHRGPPPTDVWLRTRGPAGNEVIVAVTPVRNGERLIGIFPTPSRDARAEEIERRALMTRFADAQAAFGPDMKGQPVDDPSDLERLAAHYGCSHAANAAPFCAMSHMGTAPVALPPRRGRYLGLTFEFYYPRRDGTRSSRTALAHQIAVLEVGPGRLRLSEMAPENDTERKAADATSASILEHLVGRAAGPMAAMPSLLEDSPAIAALPDSPDSPFAHTPARLYLGQVPGGDPVYVLVFPRRGGGYWVSLFPKVPWFPASTSQQVAFR